MTIVDSLLDEVGRHSTADLAMLFAELLNREARALAAAGAAVVQFDEPCFNIYLDEVRDWGIAALERARPASAPRRACTSATATADRRGAAPGRRPTRDWSHYEHTLPLLARDRIDQVSIETAASASISACSELLRGKDVLLGARRRRHRGGRDAASSRRRACAARCAHVAPERLFACTDCGLVPAQPRAAAGKMRALAAGAAIVNRELAS